ncbi:MAG: replicative DNA helicase [Candidatus Nealsonbacteria bacterium]
MENTLKTKIPPHDTPSERAVLGGLMIDRESIVKIVDILDPEDFYDKKHQDIYQVCKELFQGGEPIDVLTVSSKLKDKKILEEIGGTSYLTELINEIPTAANINKYATTVRDKSLLRELVSASVDIQSSAYNEAERPDILLDQAEARIFSVIKRGMHESFVHVKEGLAEAFERVETLSKHKGGLRGLATGFTDLDKKLSGLQKSDLIILAARPSLGKSALALNIASHVAISEGKSVGLFSLEMSKDQLIDRLIAEQGGVDLWKMRTGANLIDEDFNNIRHALDLLSRADIYIDDGVGTRILKMRAMARRLQAQKGLDLIIVDYLQLMEPDNRTANMVQQMTEISRSLKLLAKELNVPVLALSQLSRSVEHRMPPKPRLSDLRESGAIEQDADVVMFIHREDRYKEDSTNKNIAEIIIAKHRNGPVGSINLYFDEARVAFRNLEKEQQE